MNCEEGGLKVRKHGRGKERGRAEKRKNAKQGVVEKGR